MAASQSLFSYLLSAELPEFRKNDGKIGDIKGKVETIVHTCECIEPDEEIKKLLMLKSGTKVWYIERVRKKYRAFLDGKRRKRFSF